MVMGGRIQPAVRHFGIRIHVGLLIALAPLEGSHVQGLLGSQIAWLGRVDPTAGLIILFLALQRLDLGFRQDQPFCRHLLASRAFTRRLKWLNRVGIQILRTPRVETETPRLRSSLETHAWP